MRVLGPLFVAALSLTATAHVVRAETPKPTPQVEAIRSLIGSWTGKGSTSPGTRLPEVEKAWAYPEGYITDRLYARPGDAGAK